MMNTVLGGMALLLAASIGFAQKQPADEPLMDWSLWEQYRTTVTHPAALYKPQDLVRARENIARYDWAKQHRDGIERDARNALGQLTPEYLQQMLPPETPGDTLFTPCPACRDQQKPAHPHGQWGWNPADPDKLNCQICKTVFPNDRYPEDLVFKTSGRTPQTLSFYGGAPFTIFGFTTRPSFSAGIRARKVAHVTRQGQRLGEAYALTGKVEYARGAQQILLRLAEVYPGWLVHVGYGEYVDLDPRVAALNINALPVDEITPAPRGPDRKLHSGYWQGGRATGTGMEAGFVRQVLEAYEATCDATDGGQPIYTEAQRLTIERDLLLESTLLLVADKEVNNKSVGNATAVALVGMALGHPLMVRFGLDVFLKTVDGWFLADGGTSESWSYAIMTLGGIKDLGQAFRGYSDPPGYRDAEGKRLDGFDLYHDTAYKRVWEAMFNGLQGDLYYPPTADGYSSTGIGSLYAELMADNYLDNLQYLALLKEIAGPKLDRGARGTALYFRPPGREEVVTPPLTLPDYVFPVLRHGYLRGGPTGRDSCLVLSANDWGGHHHYDSLGLYYWQEGKELLSDLGYLWDHPLSHMTRRTFAHNTVMVDGAEQRGKDRGGEFTLFSAAGTIKVMEAQSKAYAQTTQYRRTVAQVEHEPGRQYLLDLFRVAGGQSHAYVFHGPNPEVQIEGPPGGAEAAGDTSVAYAVRFQLDREGSQIEVTDFSVTDGQGREVFVNGRGQTRDDKTGKPAGWGLYVGEGKAEWGAAEGPEGGVQIKAVSRGPERMNVALIAGDSEGYSGQRAPRAQIGETYRVRFRVRGNAPQVNPGLVYWPNDPANAANRVHQGLQGLAPFKPTAEWTTYEGTFRLPSAYDMKVTHSSEAVADWRLTWQITPQRRFTSRWPNEAGYTTQIGDGWGQRDFRNTDLGATLPYIVRVHPATTPSVYVTAFEGYQEGREMVRGVQRLPVPEGEADNTVAVAVTTDAGTDLHVSCLEAKPLSLRTPAGLLEVNGRYAVVSVRGGKVAAASLVEGTRLRLEGKDL
jgi:hypothetical protein